MTSLITSAEYDAAMGVVNGRLTSLENRVTALEADLTAYKIEVNVKLDDLYNQFLTAIVGSRMIQLDQPQTLKEFGYITVFGSWSNFPLGALWQTTGKPGLPRAVILQVSTRIQYVGGLSGGEGMRLFDAEFSGLASQTNPLSNGNTTNPPARRVWLSGKKDDSVYSSSDCTTIVCPVLISGNTPAPSIRAFFGSNGGKVTRECGIQVIGWYH